MTLEREDRVAWECGAGTERLLTAANFGTAHTTLRLPPVPRRRAILVSSSDPDRLRGEVDPHRFILLPDEAVVLLTRLADPDGEPDT